MKIPTIDDIQQSYIQLSLKHFTFFRKIGVSLFLSTPFQIIDEDPDSWWYTTILRRAVTETLHALSTNWGRFCCNLYFKDSMKILTNVYKQQPYRKLLVEHFTLFWQIEVSIFLSSPFPITVEDPDNWWYTTIVIKAVSEVLHALSTKLRWRSSCDLHFD